MGRLAFLLALLSAFAAGCASSSMEGPQETPAPPPLTPVEQGAKLAVSKGCTGCHVIGGQGGPTGPDLTHVGSKYDREKIKSWILDPQKVKPGTTMPRLPLTDQEAEALSAYLSEQK